MLARRFLKDCRLWLLAGLSLVLSACGGETVAPTRSFPAPQTQPEAAQQTDEHEAETPTPQDPVEPDMAQVRVAVLLPLSGPEGETGKALLNAVTMALFDAYDPRLIILPFDTQADGNETFRVAQLAAGEEIDIVLGPLLAGNVQVAGTVFGPLGIPMLGFSNDSRVAAPGRYILGFMPEAEVQRVIDFAVARGHSQFAALVPEGRYGARVRTSFGDAVSDGDARVVALESYPPDPEAVFEPVKALANYDQRRKDLTDEIRYLRSLNDDVTDEIAAALARAEQLAPVDFDAVLVPEGGALLRTVGPLLPFYEVDPNAVQLLGTGLWNDLSLTNEPPLQGAWFAAPDPVAPDAFFERYEATFGERPLRIATIAYDAMSLVAALMRDELEDGETRFSTDRLTNVAGFRGVDGLFRLLPEGLNERMLSVLEIERRGFKVIDPAPDGFPSFGYSIRQAVSREGN